VPSLRQVLGKVFDNLVLFLRRQLRAIFYHGIGDHAPAICVMPLGGDDIQLMTNRAGPRNDVGARARRQILGGTDRRSRRQKDKGDDCGSHFLGSQNNLICIVRCPALIGVVRLESSSKGPSPNISAMPAPGTIALNEGGSLCLYEGGPCSPPHCFATLFYCLARRPVQRPWPILKFHNQLTRRARQEGAAAEPGDAPQPQLSVTPLRLPT